MNRKLLSILIFLNGISFAQVIVPDLSKKEDLDSLGIGRIVEKDNSIIKDIKLYEVNANGIVYLKNESLHDEPVDTISRLDFPQSKWGYLKIIFVNKKPEVYWYHY